MDGGPIRVLLVDDEVGYLQPMRWHLEALGFIVEVAASGPGALQVAQACCGDYQVAVIDESMGPPNGTQTMLALRKTYPWIETIILTGWDKGLREAGQRAMDAGAFRFLPKRATYALDELALNIELAARFGRERRCRQTWEQITKAGQRLSGAEDLEDLYARIYEEARNVLPKLDAFVISRWNELTQRVTFVFVRGEQKPYPASRQGHRGLTEYVINCREPLLLPEGGDMFRRAHRLDPPDFIGDSASEIIAVMFLGERVLGTIKALTRDRTVRYADEHLAIFQAFANQAAVAIENLNQREESKQFAHAVARLTGLPDLNTVLVEIQRAANSLIDVDASELILHDEDGTLHTSPVVLPEDAFADGVEPRQTEGVARWVVDHRQELVIEDTLTDPRVKESTRNAGVRSLLAVPLIYGERVLGLLLGYGMEPRHFGQHDLQLWKAFATQAAMALNAAQEREREAQGIERLNRALSTFTGSIWPEKLLVQLATAAKQVFEADTCRLAYIEPSTGQVLDWVWAEGSPLEWRWDAPPRENGVTRTILRNGEPILRSDAASSETPAAVPELVARGLRSWASFPLIYGDRILAVLHLNYFQRPRRFGPADEALLRAFINPAAAALRGAIEGDRLNRALRALFAIFETLQTPASGQELLNTIARHVREALGVNLCSILTYDPQEDSFNGRGVDGVCSPEDSYARADMAHFRKWYLGEARPVVIPNAREDERLRGSQFVHRENIESAMIYALRAGNGQEPIGLLFANWRYRKVPEESEVSTFELLGNLIALMLYETRLHRQVEEDQRRLDRHSILLWMSMLEDSWRHSIVQKAASIRQYVGVLTDIVVENNPCHDRARSLLSEIDRLAHVIADAPVRVPQSWEMEAELVPLAPLLDEVGQWQNRSQASITGQVRIEADVADLGGVEVRGYRRWLINAFEILLDNARRAMPPEGGVVTICGHRTGSWAEIRIIDPGKGVPAQIRSKLFKELISKGEDESGMGLGALLAATIVEEHGGHIELEKPGPGDTTVLVKLPIV